MSLPPLVFITGASSGIGQALARAYVARGWRVALVARRVDEMGAWVRAQGWTLADLGALGGDAADAAQQVLAPTAHALPEVHQAPQPPKTEETEDVQEARQARVAQVAIYGADVRVDAEIQAAAAQCLTTQGLPEVVIANAGISVGIDLRYAQDLPVLRDLMATNVLGLAATFQPFIEPMVARGRGCLVGVASVAAARGLPGHAGYCGSKAAVVQMCETLRGELAPSGVKVVTLTPGYVATPLTQHNDYPMPFLMSPDAFAERAVRAIERGARFTVIPWPMGVVWSVLRALPRGWFDAIVGAQTHRKKRRRP